MQFKVPQDVQREDKIVGPLTFKQLIICAVGGGIAYGIYVYLGKRYYIEIWLLPVGLIALITIAFAFLKIKNLSFFRFLLMLLLYGFLPRKRSWQKKTGEVFISDFREAPKNVKESEKKGKNEKKKLHISDIEKLTKMVESHTIKQH